jgi:hypothetical protein
MPGFPELQAAYRYPTTVRDCVASGLDRALVARAPTARSDRVDELLAEPARRRRRECSRLSYGQRAARSRAREPARLLLLDEREGLTGCLGGAQPRSRRPSCTERSSYLRHILRRIASYSRTRLRSTRVALHTRRIAT